MEYIKDTDDAVYAALKRCGYTNIKMNRFCRDVFTRMKEGKIQTVLVVDGRMWSYSQSGLEDLKNSVWDSLDRTVDRDMMSVLYLCSIPSLKNRGREIQVGNLLKKVSYRRKTGNDDLVYWIRHYLKGITAEKTAEDHFPDEERIYVSGYVAGVILVLMNLYFSVMMMPEDAGISAASVFNGGEWKRLISYMFVESSPWHFVINAIALSIAAKLFGMYHGWFETVFIYLFGGLTAGLITLVWHASNSEDGTIITGSSGAAFALLSAYFIYEIVAAEQYNIIPHFILTISLILLISSIGNTDNACHIGGVIGGCLGMLILISAERAIRRHLHGYSERLYTTL